MHICPSGHQSKMATNYNDLEKGQKIHKGKLRVDLKSALIFIWVHVLCPFPMKAICYGLIGCNHPPNPQPKHPSCLNPYPQCDDVGKWGFWQIIRSWEWSPVMGLVPLKKRWDSWHPLSTLYMWGYKDKAMICKPRMRFSLDARPACSLILDLLSSRKLRNVSYLFKQSSLW